MSRQSSVETVNVYGAPQPSGFYSILQVFKPGGITGAANTPNLLLDIASDAYQAQFKELQQGGIDQATFYLRKYYEDSLDIVFGNWVVFGVQGGILASGASAGANSISVSNLHSNTNDSTGKDILNIQSGDAILISDGTNTELFLANTITGNGPDPWTITLSAAPGVGATTLLNSYANSARVVRLVYQGIIQTRERNTRRDNQFQITASGMFIRYGQATGNSSASQVDGASLMSTVLNSYSTTLPEIIVNNANLATSSIPVTVKEQDARVSQIIADILKQEDAMVPGGSNGSLNISPSSVNFPTTTSPVQTVKVWGGNAPYTVTSSDGTVATATLYGSDAVNTTTLSATSKRGDTSFAIGTTSKNINGTITTSASGSLTAGDILLFDTGLKSEFLTIASVSGSTITTTTSAVYAHNTGCTITQYLRVDVTPHGQGSCDITVTDAGNLAVSTHASVVVAPRGSAGTVWSVWIDALRQVHHNLIPTSGTPTKTLDLNTGSVYGDVAGPLDTVDMDGTNLINAAIVRGGSDASGNRIRIAVIEQYSKSLLGAWYEGVLDNSDISDEKQLANWAASQLSILAYPVTSASLELVSASMRITTQDLLSITGFTDGSTLLVNPVEIDYKIDAQSQTISATLNLGVLRPDSSDFAREIAIEKSIREVYNSPKTNLTDAFVVDGLAISTSGNTFAITSGHVHYNSTITAVPALASTTAPGGDSYWGAQMSGTPTGSTTLPAIVQMPNTAALASQYGSNVYVIYAKGAAAVPVSDFSGVPLYKVSSNGSSIVGTYSIAPQGGIGSDNARRLPNLPPTFTETSATYTASGPNAYNLTVGFSCTNPTNAASLSVWLSPHGSSTVTQSLGALPLQTSGNYVASFTSLPDSTQTYDVYAAFVDAFGNQQVQQTFFTSSAFTAPPPGAGGAMPAGTTCNAINGDPSLFELLDHGNSHGYLVQINPVTLSGAQVGALWLAEVELLCAPTGSSNWNVVGTLPPNSGGSYVWIGRVPPYSDLSVRLVDYVGNRSAPCASLATVQSYRFLQITGGPSVFGVTPNITSPALPATPTYANVGNSAYDASLTLTFDSFAQVQNTPYLASIELLISPHGTSQWAHYGYVPGQQSSSTYTCTWANIGAGNIYDLGVRYTDTASGVSNIIVAATTVANPLSNISSDFSGATLQTDGSWTNVDGKQCQLTFSSSASGDVYTVEGTVSAGSLGLPRGFTFSGPHGGTGVNSYVAMVFSDGSFQLGKWVSGVYTALTNIGVVANDTNKHTIRFAVTVGATNTLEAVIDGHTTAATDNALTISTGSVYAYTGGSSGTLRNFSFKKSLGLHAIMSPGVKGVINGDGSAAQNQDWLPNGSTYGRVKLAELTSGTVARLNDGSVIRTAANVAAIVDASGNVPNSTPLLAKVPNSLYNILADVSMQYSSTTTSISIWMANAPGTGLPSWTPPDGSAVIAPTSANCGSSASPLHVFSGLSSSTKYYFVIYYNVSLGIFQNVSTIYSALPTDSQIAAACADGTILAVVGTASSNTGILPNGGSGGISGGGGTTRPKQ